MTVMESEENRDPPGCAGRPWREVFWGRGGTQEGMGGKEVDTASRDNTFKESCYK